MNVEQRKFLGNDTAYSVDNIASGFGCRHTGQTNVVAERPIR